MLDNIHYLFYILIYQKDMGFQMLGEEIQEDCRCEHLALGSATDFNCKSGRRWKAFSFFQSLASSSVLKTSQIWSVPQRSLGRKVTQCYSTCFACRSA